MINSYQKKIQIPKKKLEDIKNMIKNFEMKIKNNKDIIEKINLENNNNNPNDDNINKNYDKVLKKNIEKGIKAEYEPKLNKDFKKKQNEKKDLLLKKNEQPLIALKHIFSKISNTAISKIIEENKIINNSNISCNIIHYGIKCQKCFTKPIVGYRYKCSICDD